MICTLLVKAEIFSVVSITYVFVDPVKSVSPNDTVLYPTFTTPFTFHTSNFVPAPTPAETTET